ncbi:dienelactone hydrolase family protein [Rhizobium sp. XQZ8]|uniref:alpha/beta hydrolase family protein n=1 Tax=Rhizobium populisoli TaxID=2859785 RepID=UPI001CA58E47|nr:dienelactone hydrolase family protein [Rhizobium populisoli]MBW6423788.1 dienelactone hydrolase family protein [Rhizobium populisoli]
MAITVARLKELLAFEEASLTLLESQHEVRDGYILERLRFQLSDSTEVRGFLTRPSAGFITRGPAIVYAHAHGARWDIGASELVDGRPALLNAPGPVLAREGYVMLCIDMPTFGERAGVTEDEAAKAALWHGKTLFGQMVSEQAAALTWLASRPEVDPKRIGVTGLSMGATLAYFLAAVDPRVKANAHLCCYADFAALVRTGAHNHHGHYLTVPGLLKETSIGEIAGLVAPRAQLICIGWDDPLTPPEAVDIAFAETEAVYLKAEALGALVFLPEAGVGHKETPAMRRAVLGFFKGYL